MTSRDWLLKAQALLLPSPFDAVDPVGEPTRQSEIKNWFSRVVTGQEQLLIRCHKDAYDAHVGLPGDEPRSPQRFMVHPLSAERTIEVLPQKDVARLYQDYLATLRDRVGPVPSDEDKVADWYRRLWHAVMTYSIDQPEARRLPNGMEVADHSVWAHRSLAAALVGARVDGGDAGLLYFHLGPVQSFINAARRTHDLWVGSFTVAFLTFQAVKAVATLLGPDAVIYPDLASLPLARKLFFDKEVTAESLLRSSLPNKFLAIVPIKRAQEAAMAAAAAATAVWTEMAQGARRYIDEEAREAGYPDWAKKWDEQIADHLELDAVVQPWPARLDEARELIRTAEIDHDHDLSGLSDEQTGAAFGALFDLSHRLLAAQRKAATPPPWQGDRRPKCAQSGIHEQMGPITDQPARQQWTSRRFFRDLSEKLQIRQSNQGSEGRLSLQLPQGEGLSAISLAKRLAPECYYGTQAAGLGFSWEDKLSDRVLLRFPSVGSIASAPFRYSLLKQQAEQAIRAAKGRPEDIRQFRKSEEAMRAWMATLADLHKKDCLDFTPPGNLLPGLGGLGDRVPYFLRVDGSWMYEDAYEPRRAWRDHYTKEIVENDKKYQELRRRATEAANAYRKVTTQFKVTPSAYYAVLKLDGDRMGQWLTGCHPHSVKWLEVLSEEIISGSLPPGEFGQKKRPLFPALHADLSRRLGLLAAKELPRIIEEVGLGRIVYSGGDDVLALLPIHTVFYCLSEIRRVMRQQDYLGRYFTLSAGIAIAQIRTPLTEVLQQARRAEEVAKEKGRDRFTIHLDKRAGAPLLVTLPFGYPPGEDGVADLMALAKPQGQDKDEEDDDSGRNGLGMVYRLQQELSALDRFDLYPAFYNRVQTLLRLDSLPRLIEVLEKPQSIIDLLLLARFLQREQHDIDPEQLWQELQGQRAS